MDNVLEEARQQAEQEEAEKKEQEKQEAEERRRLENEVTKCFTEYSLRVSS